MKVGALHAHSCALIGSTNSVALHAPYLVAFSTASVDQWPPDDPGPRCDALGPLPDGRGTDPSAVRIRLPTRGAAPYTIARRRGTANLMAIAVQSVRIRAIIPHVDTAGTTATSQASSMPSPSAGEGPARWTTRSCAKGFTQRPLRYPWPSSCNAVTEHDLYRTIDCNGDSGGSSSTFPTNFPAPAATQCATRRRPK